MFPLAIYYNFILNFNKEKNNIPYKNTRCKRKLKDDLVWDEN